MFQTIVTKEDDKLIFTSTTSTGLEKRTYEFGEAGVVMVSF